MLLLSPRSGRFWGEEIPLNTHAVTIDGLHQLARERAKERKRGKEGQDRGGGRGRQEEEEEELGLELGGEEEEEEEERRPHVRLDGEAKKLRTVEDGEKEVEWEEEEDEMKEQEREEEAMEETVGRGGEGSGDEEEGGELAPLTHSRRGAAVSTAVHRQLPSWVSHPRLVEGDIAAGSAPLDSLPLPSVVVCVCVCVCVCV